MDSMPGAGVATKTLSSSSLLELLQRHLRTEEAWHMSLRRNFTSLYMQYFQQPGAGFQQVQIVPPNDLILCRSRFFEFPTVTLLLFETVCQCSFFTLS